MLPKALDDDLLKATGLTLSEYTVLMHLSEAPDREVRTSELAALTALSVSRISRVVDALITRGWAERRRSAEDARGSIVSLTPEGFRRLESAYPALLASSRRRVMDHVSRGLVSRLADQFEAISSRLG